LIPVGKEGASLKGSRWHSPQKKHSLRFRSY
jgi:hypothetical protein